MNKNKKLAISGLLIALGVLGSFFSFPFLGSKCAPVQHLVNVVSAILIGPFYAVSVAFLTSLLRNLMAIGSLLAFPGSMFGALLSACIYKKHKKISFAVFGEIFGTAILGGLASYPIAILFMGKRAGEIAFYIYVFPFFVSTFVGGILAGIIMYRLNRTGVLDKINNDL